MTLQLTGGSRSEADTIVTFLNLPHGGTLQKKSLLIIENKLGRLIQKNGEKISGKHWRRKC